MPTIYNIQQPLICEYLVAVAVENSNCKAYRAKKACAKESCFQKSKGAYQGNVRLFQEVGHQVRGQTGMEFIGGFWAGGVHSHS
jgi:hypothetical protein